MKVVLDEQDLIDAVCVHSADRHRVRVGEVKAELIYDQSHGIGAEATVGRETMRLSEQDVVDSVAVLLSQYYQFEPERLTIELGYEAERGLFAEAALRS